MLKLQTVGTATVVTVPSYAAQKNAKYSSNASHVISAPQRWKDTLASLPADTQKIISQHFALAQSEFKRRNPSISKWNQLLLAEAKLTKLISVEVDTTMQRELDIMWGS